MDGAIGRALQQRLFQLGSEESLAALFLERPVELAVTGGDDLKQLALDAGQASRSRAATSSACASASGLFRVARMNFGMAESSPRRVED